MIARHRSASSGNGGRHGGNGGNGGTAAHGVTHEPAMPPIPPTPTEDAPGFPNDSLTLALMHVGMTVHEGQMYLTLLRHGPSTARFAIHESGLDRATGYRILSRLRARGLVTATGYRPQRFVALDALRLLDRVSSILRDELEMHRVVREIYAAALPPARDLAPAGPAKTVAPAPEPSRPPALSLATRYQLLPGPESLSRFIVDHLGQAREEMGALLRPALVPEPQRSALVDAILHAISKGVRCRLVLDYHPADLDFLTAILRGVPEPSPVFEVRFFAPQLARLYVIDRRTAVRCLSNSGGPSPPPGTLGIASEDLEFVRVQNGRFQTTWREAVPLETALRSPQGSVLAPPSSSPELRHWVERPGRTEARAMTGDGYFPNGQRIFRH